MFYQRLRVAPGRKLQSPAMPARFKMAGRRPMLNISTHTFRHFAQAACTALLLVLTCVMSAQAQQSGIVRGIVKDPTGKLSSRRDLTIRPD